MFVAVITGLAGASLGSFAVCAVDRQQLGQSLLGRSRCEGCGRQLPAWALVPVLGWVIQRGRAACCGAAIPARSTWVETTAGVGAALVVAATGPATMTLALGLILTAVIVTLRRS